MNTSVNLSLPSQIDGCSYTLRKSLLDMRLPNRCWRTKRQYCVMLDLECLVKFSSSKAMVYCSRAFNSRQSLKGRCILSLYEMDQAASSSVEGMSLRAKPPKEGGHVFSFYHYASYKRYRIRDQADSVILIEGS